MLQHAVTLGRAWWWAQNWAHFFHAIPGCPRQLSRVWHRQAAHMNVLGRVQKKLKNLSRRNIRHLAADLLRCGHATYPDDAASTPGARMARFGIRNEIRRV